jgi:ribonuclease HepT-like protein
VWPDLKDQIAVEDAQLQQLLELHQPLLEKCRSEDPNPIELSALAALLHSFYTGVENLFRRVAVEIDGVTPQGDAWHRRLLQQMTESGEARPEVVSAELYDRLHPYLQFRHVFRNSYSFQLRWDKMAPLVLRYEDVCRLACRGRLFC